MVHALDLIHDLLKPGGTLIDLHPSGQKPSLEIITPTSREIAGWLDETDNFSEYFQAEAAINKAIEAGWFESKSRQEFRFNIYAKSLVEFQEYLSENWKDAVISEAAAARINQILPGDIGPDNYLVVAELIYITRLRKR